MLYPFRKISCESVVDVLLCWFTAEIVNPPSCSERILHFCDVTKHVVISLSSNLPIRSFRIFDRFQIKEKNSFEMMMKKKTISFWQFTDYFDHSNSLKSAQAFFIQFCGLFRRLLAVGCQTNEPTESRHSFFIIISAINELYGRWNIALNWWWSVALNGNKIIIWYEWQFATSHPHSGLHERRLEIQATSAQILHICLSIAASGLA